MKFLVILGLRTLRERERETERERERYRERKIFDLKPGLVTTGSQSARNKTKIRRYQMTR